MKVVRTIHPVGQGAFYTERFFLDGGKEINIIYDCGSNNKRVLKKEINSYFSKGSTVDILFLSHFDSDHVNGIAGLLDWGVKFRYVVVPRYDDNRCLEAIIFNNPKLKRLIYDKSCKVVQVKPVEYSSDSNLPTTIDLEESPQYIDSYSEVTLNGLKPIWMFIPIYYEEKGLIDVMDEIQEKTRCLFPNLEDPTFINSKRKYINDAYNKAFGRNAYSMILYSGSSQMYKSRLLKTYIEHNMECDCEKFEGRRNHEACLYIGDALLEPRIIDIKNKLGQKVNRIGLLQIPHHGSSNDTDIKNICVKLDLQPQSTILFASFGKRNMYAHPSLKLIEDTMYLGFHFIGITEQRDSAYIEMLEID